MSLPETENNRIYLYLAKIAGKSVQLTEPRNRLERFLAYWAGMNVTLPDAPYTRMERFLLAAMGEGELPSGCYTRYELFLNNIADGVAALPETDDDMIERYLREIASAVVEIVYEGNLPTTIPGAIHELIRYGKCVQDGTPTPSSPVDIVCNNGVLKARRQSGLPLGYQRVQWIKSVGYIVITGFKTKSTQELETVFYREQSGVSYLYSSDTATSGTTNTTAYLTSGSGNWRWGGESYSIAVSTGIKFTSIQNKYGVWLNGTKTGWYSGAGEFVSTNDLRLSSSENTTICIYSMTIREGEAVTLDLVPVQRLSDSAYGFYDKVSGNFYTDAEATITAGDPVNDPVEIYTDGTPEVLSIGGQLLSVPNLLGVGDYKDTAEFIGGLLTHKVGIYVFTGAETFINGQNGWITQDVQDQFWDNATPYSPLCTHFVGTDSTPVAGSNTVRVYRTSENTGRIYFGVDKTIPAFSSTMAFAAWLGAQYNAGTPVIVLYPLAEQTTEEVTPQHISSSGAVSSTTNAPPAEVKITYHG